MKIEKVYHVFESLFLEKKGAEALLEGWEHKERIKVKYAIITEEDEQQIIDGVNHGYTFSEVSTFDTKEHALDELKIE